MTVATGDAPDTAVVAAAARLWESVEAAEEVAVMRPTHPDVVQCPRGASQPVGSPVAGD
jgi:hypothetical protein